MSGGTIFLTNFASTWFLVGLIWLVQVVVYPQFLRVTTDCFPGYHKAHLRAITYVVAPAMLVELVSSVGLVVHRPDHVVGWIAWAGMACVGVCWLSTAFVQVPLHNLLTRGFSSGSVSRLVATNWLRTIGWTLHGILLACA